MATITAADKKRIHQAFLDWADRAVEQTEQVAGGDEEAAEVVQDDAHSVDDTWQKDQAADMESLLDDTATLREEKADSLADLDVSPTDVVRPGAVVEVAGQRYLVGVVAADEVDVDGTSYAGLSTDSPLYEAIQGLRAGDEFTFRDERQVVALVG